MRVGVVLPTYFNDEWYEIFEKHTESLVNLKSIDNLIFLVNYQNFDEDDERAKELKYRYNETVKSLNPTWSVRSVENPKYDPLSMCRIKNDCMILDPDCDLYLFIDDDHFFREGSAEHYQFSINHFIDDPDLGVVMSASFLGGYNYKWKLKYDYSKFFFTNYGLFLRNIHQSDRSPIYCDYILDNHIGGYEDVLAPIEIFRKNLKMATHFNCPTYHRPSPTMDLEREEVELDEYHRRDTIDEFFTNYVKHEFDIDIEGAGADNVRKLFKTLYRKGIGYQYNE